MNFRADNDFDAYTGQRGGRLSIYYNFGAFDLIKGCSRIYDPASPFYSSFYGAYVVRNADGSPYGFMTNGDVQDQELTADADAISRIARLDFSWLVLADFGLAEADQVFEWSEEGRRTGLDFAGSGGWTRIDASLFVNGMAHAERRPNPRSYLQYGAPAFPAEDEFAPVQMRGIIVGKYFPEKSLSIFFYVISPDAEVCRDCLENILSESTLVMGT